MPPLVTLYTRAGCCLCDQAKSVIQAARRRTPFDYEEVDIDSDPALRAEFNDHIPVVSINHVRAFKYRLDLREFLKKLAARA